LKQILFFSNNKNKLIEIKKIFNKFDLKLLSLKDVNISDEPEEVGITFEENAKIKSDYGFNKTGLPCFADDSGICIESLNWRPGVNSKRFIHKFKNEEDCFKHIIKRVEVSGKKKAYFKTSISLSINKNYNLVFSGKIDGKISSQRKGDFGFGYDPIFIPNSFNKTFAELSTKEKNELSHRSIAVTKLVNFLVN
jgi:XTP/dITP diphosphohydrolase